ncbi:MAG: acetyl-CoA hydrolase/transferase C-terminal domain-containing protein [Clostridia bacterium]|nr:acetyl-CoA hydrolase/transferase C-terminal domain-containing protein [Clostridia bacterium]
MDPKELYRRKLVAIEDAVAQVKSNQSIVIAMCAAEPPGLLNAVSSRKDELENVTIMSCLLMRDYEFLKPEMKGHFLNEAWYYGPNSYKAHAGGTVAFLPNNLHECGVKKRDLDPADIFWGTATPMDKNGYMSLALSVTYEKPMIAGAKMVVLEINENLPRTFGDTQIHISQVDYVVENTVPLVELQPIEPTDTEAEIGRNVASLIEDGSTLQLGIGGIPNAVTSCLLNKHDLGVHTEMVTDGMVDLFNAGALNGRRKTLWPEKMVGCFALGTKKLYDFVDDNLGVEFYGGHITNDPYVIGQNHKMVSINTTLQVDLTGQANSETLGVRQYSGAGGAADTCRGAQRSAGGKSILALRSTAKNGTISTIVPCFRDGQAVTITRSDIDYVVTEYGIAHLKSMNVRKRVDRLIAIAHPDFREGLWAEARALSYV